MIEQPKRRLNLIVGIAGCVAFVATGVWMKVSLPGDFNDDLLGRMMHRSAHIYILLSAMLNLLVTTQRAASRPRLASIGAGMIAAAPVIFLTAFIVEPMATRPARPICLLGVVFSIAGTISLVIAASKRSVSEAVIVEKHEVATVET